MTTETHPLKPFLPENATMLFLGSFPPPRQKWSMDFFYPNWINDFWRIMGIIHFGDKCHFEIASEKRFDQSRIVTFALQHGMAFYDTASKVRRLKDNASDNFLEILEPTDIKMLVDAMPQCRDIVTTGGKASEELQRQLAEASLASGGSGPSMPPIGEFTTVEAYSRTIRWWRMPSSSRAFPLAIAKKAEYYKRLFI